MDLGYLNIPFIYRGSDLVHPSPIKDGLVLWYDFSGMSNSFENRDIATDLSGNGNHGTLQNFSYSEGSGYDKRGLLFDGVDDYVHLENNETLEIVESLTLEQTFIKTAEHNVDDENGWDWLIMNGSTSNSREGYGLYISSKGYIGMQFGNEAYISNYSPRKGESIHVIAVYNHLKNNVTITINGQEIYRNDNADGAPLISNRDLSIGRAMYYSVSPRFDAYIFSSRIYNHPLSASEIAHNYEIEKERFGIGGSEL